MVLLRRAFEQTLQLRFVTSTYSVRQYRETGNIRLSEERHPVEIVVSDPQEKNLWKLTEFQDAVDLMRHVKRAGDPVRGIPSARRPNVGRHICEVMKNDWNFLG